MSSDKSAYQSALPSGAETGDRKPFAGVGAAPTGAALGAVRSCYGVVLAGATPTIVRSRRTAFGGIQHAAVTPADAAAWQQWLLERARPDTVVVGCLPVQESLTLWLQAPFASSSKAEKVLPSLLDVQLPFPLENCRYCFADIRRMPDDATRALAVAARLENLQARLHACREAGFDPVLLDHEGLALWTQSREEYSLPTAARRVILHLDSDHVALVIGQGDCYENAHSVQAGLPAAGADFQPFLAGLVNRLQRILRAELSDAAGLHWLASGPGARNASLLNALHQALAGEWPGARAVHLEPETFLARALGTRALTGGAFRCNLRINDLAHPLLVKKIRGRALTTAALFLAVGLLLCGINLAWKLVATQRANAIKQAVAGLTAELSPGIKMPYGQELREVQKIAAQRQEREAPFLNPFEPSLAVRLAELIRVGKEQDVGYETLTLQRAGFVLGGAADDWDQCERLAAGLRALGYTVKLERQEAGAESQVHWTIKGEQNVLKGKPTPGPSREGKRTSDYKRNIQ
jgi:hypothetical protein